MTDSSIYKTKISCLEKQLADEKAKVIILKEQNITLLSEIDEVSRSNASLLGTVIKLRDQLEYHNSRDKDGFNFDKDGFGEDGFNKDGFDIDGYDFEGLNVDGCDKYGVCRRGYDSCGNYVKDPTPHCLRKKRPTAGFFSGM